MRGASKVFIRRLGMNGLSKCVRVKATLGVLFPLTPALSLREREKLCGAVLQVSAGLANDGPSLFPLLGERVRGRGKGAHEFNSVMRPATLGVLFPLTPALSLREREKLCGAVLQVSASLANDGPSLFP